MTTATEHDVIILGAGMAGASLAAELAPTRRVLLLEIESQPGRHATGRSAAMFFENYGNALVRALTRCSRAFLLEPPPGFVETPLMQRRDALLFADEPRLARLDSLLAAPGAQASLRRIDAAAALARCPILRPECVAGAVLDTSGHDIDVAALHQAFLRRARQHGAMLAVDARSVGVQRADGQWSVRTRDAVYRAATVVNATGAWADDVAAQAGVARVGLRPLRRSALTIPAPPEHDTRGWPLVIDVDETLYFKPDAGHLLLSPANEDDNPPCDVAPDELDVAIAVDRFEKATTVAVSRVLHRWAGLRTFAADRSPVVGFDPAAEGFFWLAGQGGYGIQMAPALARAAAALVRREPLPADIAAEGVTIGALSPARWARWGQVLPFA